MIDISKTGTKLLNLSRRNTPQRAGPLATLVLVGMPALTLACDAQERGEPPYPPSSLITGVSFGPPEKATPDRAGDTWPITWAEDGRLYTAWADGQGPRHPDDERVSMGFARVEGGPADPVVYKIASLAEQEGDGSSGRKASGMLMVDGVLYMWVRNDNQTGEQCRLWWSTDEARTWNQTDWNFPEFGYCTFVNFGQNYRNARDEYVYMVSHNHPSAYEYADDFILARVEKGQILHRDSYSFFRQLDEGGSPIWARDISDRGSIFHHPDRAQRSSMTYNAGIGRYLLWQGGYPDPDGQDPRFNDSPLGIYEAPEPWGPWRTVYYTERFRGGPGETGSFPAKWMESVTGDKQSIFMVTSTDDAFSVWPVTFEIDGSDR